MSRHLLRLTDLSVKELWALVERARMFKKQRSAGFGEQLREQTIALYMELPSTRTRLSFQVAIAEMGGHCVNIERNSLQLQRGEPIEDFARVCSELFSAVIVRSLSHKNIIDFCQHSNIPVINALSDHGHPCQVIADLLTLSEHFTDLNKIKIVWLGDGNNVCRSWIEAADMLGLSLTVSTPAQYQPKISPSNHNVRLVVDDPHQSVRDADVLMTDVWASMGSAELSEEHKQIFAPYQINQECVERTGKNPVILHCMPIHRGEEIAADIVDGSNSMIFHQAANRLHAHKAILEFLVNKTS